MFNERYISISIMINKIDRENCSNSENVLFKAKTFSETVLSSIGIKSFNTLLYMKNVLL